MIGVFTDQAYNLILLAEDEARMLGQPTVEPEHLLLALARSGNVQRAPGPTGRHRGRHPWRFGAGGGLGDDLVLGRVPRSPATEDALERAVDAAAARGVLGPSSEHVLLGLRDDARAMTVFREVGIVDVDDLVDEVYPATRGPLDNEKVKSYALRVGTSRTPPQPGPIPPVFERFTAEARRAVEAAERSAASLMNSCVAPSHFLLGLLQAGDSVAAHALARHRVTLEEATKRAQLHGPGPAHQATGIFTDAARRLATEDALKQAYRHGHGSIGTGHLLLATLDSADKVTSLILGAGPAAERVAREVVRQLPGDEHI